MGWIVLGQTCWEGAGGRRTVPILPFAMVVRTSLYVQVSYTIWLGGRVSDDVVGSFTECSEKSDGDVVW